MATTELALLKQEIKQVKKDLNELKTTVKEQGEELEQLPLIAYKLEGISKAVESIDNKLSKDGGWRGFFLDFIKAAAQIAVLIGAGKWIF